MIALKPKRIAAIFDPFPERCPGRRIWFGNPEGDSLKENPVLFGAHSDFISQPAPDPMGGG